MLLRVSAITLAIVLCSRIDAADVADSAAQVLQPRERYLLLDNRVVESTSNARLVVGTVEKHPDNPLFTEDRAWEVRFDNLYPNILFDEAEQLFKCWYSPFIRDVEKIPPMSEWDHISYPEALRKLTGDTTRKMGVCYATSKDGIDWNKPTLNLIEFEGSFENNLVFAAPHGAGIFNDLRDPDPGRRYKMITGEQPHGTLSYAYSPDGLRWSELHPIASVPGDTHNNVLFDPVGNQYVAISREFDSGNRTVVRMESKDFVLWSEPREILRGTKLAQTYAMPITHYHGVFLGLIAVFHTATDRVSTELAWSPDTEIWHRIEEGTPLIPLSESRGDYDWGCAYAGARPVEMPNGEIRIYYGASNGKHTSWRDGFLALATLPPDGWAGYQPTDLNQEAIIRTELMKNPGTPLRIVADADAGGSIRVTIEDEQGNQLAAGTPSSVSEERNTYLIKWENDYDVSLIQNQAICLRFSIGKGRIYSFRFE